MQKIAFFVVFLGFILLGSGSAFAQKQAGSFEAKQRLSVITGEVGMIVRSFVNSESSVDIYTLQTKDRLYTLDGDVSDLSQAVGQKVKVTGFVALNQIDVRSHDFRPSPPTPPIPFPEGISEYLAGSVILAADESPSFEPQVAPPTVGDRPAFVVMVRTIGAPQHLATASQLNTTIFTGSYSVRDFFRKVSFSRFNLTGEVNSQVIDIPFTAANCESMMFNEWHDYIMQVLANDPRWVNAKTRVMVYPELESCTIAEQANMGQKGDANTPRNVWMVLSPTLFNNGLEKFIGLLAHGIGHNLGAPHSNGITLSGTTLESADRGCFVANRFRNPTIYMRLALGWFNGRLTALSGPRPAPDQGIPYELYLSPIDQIARFLNPRNGLVVQLKDANGNISTKLLVIEVRRNYEYDVFGNINANYTTGLLVRLCDADMSQNSSKSYLYDLTPNSLDAFEDAGLPIGQTITLQEHGITIEHVSRTLMRGSHVRIWLTR